MKKGLLILFVLLGCASNQTAIQNGEKPYVEAVERTYSFDHIEGLAGGLAGDGLTLPEMLGGQGMLQRKVNAFVKDKPCPVRGRVMVVYVVDERGDVLDAAAATGIEESCDATAEAAAKTLKFKPATKDGVPVKIRMGTPVDFN